VSIPVILCAATDATTRTSLCEALRIAAEGRCDVEDGDAGTWLRTRAVELAARGVDVPVAFVTDDLVDGSGLDALLRLRREGAATRGVLVAASIEPEAIAPAVRAGALSATLSVPWSSGQLRSTLDRLVTEYLVAEDPEGLEQVPELVDVAVLSHAYAEVDERNRATTRRLEELQQGFLADRDLDDDEVERAVIDEIDRVLDRPERRAVPAGTQLVAAGDPVDGVLLVLDGDVRLSRTAAGREIVFHQNTTGRIIGLLALARMRPAVFDVVAVSDVTVLPVSLGDLDRAFRASQTLAVHFAAVLVRSLARRNLRAIELRIERDRLAQDLAAERDRLAEALERLTSAQTHLVESDRLATLGRLVAGIAHELNNPVAALLRATEYLRADVPEVVGDRADVIGGALERAPMSTRDERTARRELAGEVGERVAERLVAAGITDTAAYRELLEAGLDAEEAAATLERLAGVGTALRNVNSAAERIGALVRSLRSYARDNGASTTECDVREGIAESLQLLGHELHGIEVVRDFEDPGALRGHPGALNQVWTNLINNALQAMEGEGTLIIRTRPGPDAVTVEVEDSGPGIPPDDIGRIFDMHFTTKGGRVEFGLGLGLRIAQDVVERHGGSIDVASEPGRTVFTVTLPRGGTP
jgi:signal transduction histidine kinase